MLDDPLPNALDKNPLGSSFTQDENETGSSSTDGLVSEIFSLHNTSSSIHEDLVWDPNASNASDSLAREHPDHDHESTLPLKQHIETTFSSTLRKKNNCRRTPTLPVSTIRLSSFGIEKPCPVSVEIYSSVLSVSDTNGSTITHVEDIYGWAQRKSHDASSTVLETASVDEEVDKSEDPQMQHQKQSLMIRQSRGNPSYAKKVNIPKVPHLPKLLDSNTIQLNQLNRYSSNPPISPHRINNFVCESSPNRFIFDFGDPLIEKLKEEGSLMSTSSNSDSASIMNTSTSSLSPYQNVLVAKMKETKLNFQRTISGTLTRRKKHKSGSATLPSSNRELSAPPSCFSSQGILSKKTSSLLSIERDDETFHTKESSEKVLTKRKSSAGIRKPQEPPPPRPNVSRPSAPPPPPPSIVSKDYVSLASTVTKESFSSAVHTINLRQENVLEEFKIDLNTCTESIPKTGFDFLDDW